MEKIKYAGVALGIALFVAGPVSAHITVQPKEAVAGYSVSVIRVPNEKDVATTNVRVVVPEGVDVHGIMPIAGWQYSVKRETPPESSANTDDHGGDDHADSGRITEVTWSGGKIGAGEFMEFPLSVQYAAGSQKVEWKAYQTYAGGEIVPWDGSDEKHPAPVVTVVSQVSQPAAPGMQVVKNDKAVWTSVVALLVSVGAFAVALKKK